MSVTSTLYNTPSSTRESSCETAPLLGVRTSHGGCYLLLLFKGAPAELWTVSRESHGEDI